LDVQPRTDNKIILASVGRGAVFRMDRRRAQEHQPDTYQQRFTPRKPKALERGQPQALE